jgi:hypothetical protein
MPSSHTPCECSLHLDCLFRIRKSSIPLALIGREDVRRLQSVSRVIRSEDVLLLALPFRVVDSIDPVLDLHDDAAVLFDDAGAALVALGGFDGKGP